MGSRSIADNQWQRQFDASFPYVETPDQVKAIETTKIDMELPKPMDRLICGDVGFGKTEVAMRAAFKAVDQWLSGRGAGADDRLGGTTLSQLSQLGWPSFRSRSRS